MLRHNKSILYKLNKLRKGIIFLSKNWRLLKNRISLQLQINVFVAQLVEQMTLNHWVRGSSPREDTP